MAPFSEVLVANRGEIAVRVLRTLRELGIGAVAVYSDPDRGALHVAMADDAYRLGPGPPRSRTCAATRSSRSRSVRAPRPCIPDTGSSRRTPSSRGRSRRRGSCGSGRPPRRSRRWGRRSRRASACERPACRSSRADEPPRLGRRRRRRGRRDVGYPIAIKASAGGGGKGLRVAWSEDEVERAFETARREGEAYFADATVYVERYLDDPRHVEVQILADAHGNVVHLGERDCTIQRRHQKLVEETPSPAVDEELRARIGAIAIDAARAVDYRSAGTIEGLLDTDGSYYFLEMNTRVQVEHTVTEAVTGIDIVREQVLVAAGEPLSVSSRRSSSAVTRSSAASTRRTSRAGSCPSPGRITAYREPAGIGVRVDSGVRAGDEISDLYDPLVAKLVVHDVDRERARRRMLRALEEFVIAGPTTLLGFHRALLETAEFAEGATCRGLVESEELAERARELDELARASLGAALDGRGPAARAPTTGSSRSRSTASATTFVSRSRNRRGSSSGAGTASAAEGSGVRGAAQSRARCRERCSQLPSRPATQSRPGPCSASWRR